MTRKTLLVPLLIALAITPIATHGFVLDDAFDLPCPTGQAVVQQVCMAVNDLHDLSHDNESRINSVNATQISEQFEQDEIQVELSSLSSVVSQNIEDIISLNSTQILELNEQNTIQTDLDSVNSTLETHLALPITTAKTIVADNDLTSCETVGAPAPGWCPQGTLAIFNITDIDVSETSFVSTHVDNAITTICGVSNIEDGWFVIWCLTTPPNGSELHYIIVD